MFASGAEKRRWHRFLVPGFYLANGATTPAKNVLRTNLQKKFAKTTLPFEARRN
jgi:hypothetical protein